MKAIIEREKPFNYFIYVVDDRNDSERYKLISFTATYFGALYELRKYKKTLSEPDDIEVDRRRYLILEM